MKSKDEMNLEQRDNKEVVEMRRTSSAREDTGRNVKAKQSESPSSKKSQAKKKTASAKSKSRTQQQRKDATAEAVGTSKEGLQSPVNLVEVILKEFISIQKVWFEISLQQTEALLKLVSSASGVGSESVDAVGKMMKQNAENFIALQNQWSKILAKQSAEITGSLKHISKPFGYPAIFKKNVEVFLESISQMQNAWAEFLQKQSEQINETVKKSLGADEKSQITYVTNFADPMLKSILEAQRRWLEVATRLFSSGKSSSEKD
jgi:hypothetical protein